LRPVKWDRASHAYSHYEVYLNIKPKLHDLSFTDLVYVKNFKGGSATITEPMCKFADKISYYTEGIHDIALDSAGGSSLGILEETEYERIKNKIVRFATLPEQKKADISGFGCSFASALLHFHFPLLVPILDKRALNGSGLYGLTVDKQGNVTNLLELYPALIDYFRLRLKNDLLLTLRDLDRELFIKKLQTPPFPLKQR
jgi:hypothetical protein